MSHAPWAAIFDWDGVILDSARQHEASWEQLATEEGFALPADHFKRGFGMKNETIIPSLLGWTTVPSEIRRMSQRKEELYRQILRAAGVHPLPGVHEWLRRLHAAAIPCVVASSTCRLNITCALDQLELGVSFQAIVAAEDVSHGKPDPEVFLLAAQRLRCAPQRCVVFEDTPVGIQAAKAAGMKAVAVTTTHPVRYLDGADRIVPRLDALQVEELTPLFAALNPPALFQT